MNKKQSLVIGLVILISITSLYSLTPDLISRYRYTYNMTSGHHHEFSLSSSLTFNSYFKMEAGVSTEFHALPENFYIRGEIHNFPAFLVYGLTILQQSFPDYEMTESTIYPSVTLLGGHFLEFELGATLRIVNSEIETLSFHPLYKLQFNILNLKPYGLSFSLANFNDFQAGNISHIRYNLNNRITLSPSFNLYVSAGFFDSGQLAFASFFSAFFGEIGLRYTP